MNPITKLIMNRLKSMSTIEKDVLYDFANSVFGDTESEAEFAAGVIVEAFTSQKNVLTLIAERMAEYHGEKAE